MPESAFISFAVQPNKRRRADLACETCHSKKVKCDLQSKLADGQDTCSHCTSTGRTCRQRTSKRRKKHSVYNQPIESHADLLTSPSFDERIQLVEAATASSLLNEAPEGTVSASTYDVQATTTGYNADIQPQISNALNVDVLSVPIESTSDNCPTTRSLMPTSVYTTCTTFMDVYGPESENDALNQELAVQEQANSVTVLVEIDPSPELLQSFREIYYENCYAFCPVLDTTSLANDLSRSRLLCNALAAAASHIRSPMIPHRGPSSYYTTAKQIFYSDEEPDILLSLKALSLFYWWSPKPPTAIHRDSSWWWQSVIIRHAQQMGFHREPTANHPRYCELDLSFRRKLWWTAFARERLTALCQGRPSIIDLDDCSIQLPSESDFKETEAVLQKKAVLFVHWVKLCVILGKLAKHQLRSLKSPIATSSSDFVQQLLQWIDSSPQSTRMNIAGTTTTDFDMDVHQLHLPYLAAIVVLHLKHNTNTLPFAKPPAILAASCVARILKDVLARGKARSLMAITCWYTGISFLALLSARRHVGLSEAADEDLDILELAIKQLKLMWPTANIFQQGFRRLRSAADSVEVLPEVQEMFETDSDSNGNTNWSRLFPFANSLTSKVTQYILTNRQQIRLEQQESSIPQPMMSYLQELFDPSDGMEFLDMQLFS